MTGLHYSDSEWRGCAECVHRMAHSDILHNSGPSCILISKLSIYSHRFLQLRLMHRRSVRRHGGNFPQILLAVLLGTNGDKGVTLLLHLGLLGLEPMVPTVFLKYAIISRSDVNNKEKFFCHVQDQDSWNDPFLSWITKAHTIVKCKSFNFI